MHLEQNGSSRPSFRLRAAAYLLHAADEPIYGAWIIEELAHHGYKLSAGTLYPVLHAMEKKGYLTGYEERDGRPVRRFYRATNLGCEGLALARDKARVLFGELVEGHGRERRPSGNNG